MADIIVLYRPAGPSVLGTQHKDILLKMDDGSYLRAYNVPDSQETGNWGGHKTIVDRIPPELAELYESTYFAHPMEIVTTGDESSLYSLMISVIEGLQQISNSDVGYAPLDTNSNWAADKALYQAALPLPQEDDFFENYSPGSIEYSQIPERIADDYGPREGEVDGVFDGVISTPSEQEGEQCFLAGTPITMWPVDQNLKPGPDGVYDKEQVRAGLWTKPIEQVSPKDLVLAHDKNGNMVPGYVDKLFGNTTQEFVRLNFSDDREDLITTPGHRFLTETSEYMEIGHMLRLGGGTARLVDVDGSIIEATGEVIAYSAETAHLFEQAQTKTISMAGNTVLKEQVEQGWKTYNFEVQEHHNYVAGAVRVHNDSILSTLQAGDQLIALNSDLTDAAVLRDVNGNGFLDFVTLDGYRRDGEPTQIAVERHYHWDASEEDLARLESVLGNLSSNGTSATENVFDPTAGQNANTGTVNDHAAILETDQVTPDGQPDTLNNNTWGDGDWGDDIEEAFFDDVLPDNVFSNDVPSNQTPSREYIDGLYRENGAVNVININGQTFDPISSVTDLENASALIGAIKEAAQSPEDAIEIAFFLLGASSLSLPEQTIIRSGLTSLFSDVTENTVEGTAASDVLSGTAENDAISGLEGDDFITGGVGNDQLTGGDGTDRFFFFDGDGADTITDFDINWEKIKINDVFISPIGDPVSGVTFTQQGDDLVISYNGDTDSITLTDVNLDEWKAVATVYGTAGDNAMTGTDGNDVMEGLGGADTMHGGQGDDRIYAGPSGDFLYGGQGNDILGGNTGDDYIEGNRGTDILRGHEGTDTLLGGGGDDYLYGNEGNDTLDGGNGSDRLFGGDGNDVFVFTAASHSFGADGMDSIRDFKNSEGEEDKIDLTAFEDLTFSTTGLAGANTVAFRLSASEQNGYLEADFDGDGTADFQVFLLDVKELDASDLLL